MPSAELRKLKWEDVEIEVIGGGHTQERKLAKVKIPALNSKVRKFKSLTVWGLCTQSDGENSSPNTKKASFLAEMAKQK